MPIFSFRLQIFQFLTFCLWVFAGFGGGGLVWGQDTGSLFKPLGSTVLPGAPLAMAVNGDESMVAVAMPGKGDRMQVALVDRRSRKILGWVATETGKNPQLAFSKDADILAVGGADAIELWEVPIEPLRPDKALSLIHQRWRTRLKENPLGRIAFSPEPGFVTWSAGVNLYRRGVQTQSTFNGDPAWKGPASFNGPVVFAYRGQKPMVLGFPEKKSLETLSPKDFSPLGKLAGHRFPFSSLDVTDDNALLSLDQGGNLIAWKGGGEPGSISFLEPLKKGYQPKAIHHLAGKYNLVLSGSPQKTGGGAAQVFDARKKTSIGTFPLEPPGTLAISPTGRYLILGSGNTARFFRFTHPLSPRVYAQQLVARKAHRMARSYADNLDEKGLAKGFKANLKAELRRAPPQVVLNDLLASLDTALKNEDLEGIGYWTSQVMVLSPGHPQAKAALKTAVDISENRLVTQAKVALNAGQHRMVIQMLKKGIPPTSQNYGKALALMKSAEHGRAIMTGLDQAREKMNLGNYPAADAVVNEVLRNYGETPAALELKEEIEDRQTGHFSEGVIGLLGALLLGAFLWLFFRRGTSQISAWFMPSGIHTRRKQTVEEHRKGVRAHERPEAQRPVPPKGPSRAYLKQLQETKNLKSKVEEMVRLVRSNDKNKEHTAILMELEAELNALGRRILDQGTDLTIVMARMGNIQEKLKKVAATRPGPKDKNEQAGPAREKPKTGDYYQRLGVSRTASEAEIKKSYHKLIKEYHPDLHNHSSYGWIKEEAEKMSRQIREAYDVLKDSATRARYDSDLKQGKK